MPKFPPLCITAYFVSNGEVDPDDPLNPNLFGYRLNITPQTYSTGQWDETSIEPGMWATNASDGYVFRIKTILNVNPGYVNVILEDVDGKNALIDPTQFAGGGPIDSSPGYIFELNPLTGLPALTSLGGSLPSFGFPDQIVGRFIYDQTSGGGGSTYIEGKIGPTGPRGPTGPSEKFSFDGPTGSILFYDGNSITGTSNVTYITNTEGTGTINITNLVIENIIFSGTGTADVVIDNFFGCIIHLKAKKIELMKIMDDYFTQKITRIETTNRLALLNSTIA